MTTSKVSISTYSLLNQKQQHNCLLCCTLKWRQGQLLVIAKGEQPHLPALEDEQWLVNCLRHSPVRLLRIDAALGEASLQFWADVCEQADKAVFLRLPSAYKLPRKQFIQMWLQLIDCFTAALLLLLFSPVMLGLACLLRIQSPDPIFCRQRCVGERGKIFCLFKFRTVTMNTRTFKHGAISNQKSLHCEDDQSYSSLGCWMRKYHLDDLPRLFNVLRGEVNLKGPHPPSLGDLVRLSSEDQ